MSKYIYLGTDGDKVIFYNELKMSFIQLMRNILVKIKRKI